MSLTIGAAFREATKALRESATPEIDARALLKHITGLDAAGLIANETRALGADECERFEKAVRRRAHGEPVSQIVGYREFWGLRFDIDSGVLTPRPDTETLIEAVLSRRPDHQYPYRILDLGLGSGCILGALLNEYPAATGVGVDIDSAAVSLARRNLDRLGLRKRARCVQGDWCAAIDGEFDIIVSNPPYIRSGDRSSLPVEVREYESARALFAGEDGLDAYRRLASVVGPCVKRGGLIVVEAGQGQAEDVARTFQSENPQLHAAFRADLAGCHRAVILW